MWFLRLPQPPEDYKPLGFLVTTDKPGLDEFEFGVQGPANEECEGKVFQEEHFSVFFHPEDVYLPSSVSRIFKNGALLYRAGDLSGEPIDAGGNSGGTVVFFHSRVCSFTGQLWNSGGDGVEAYDLEYIAGNRATVYSSKNGHASFPHPGCYIQGSPKLRRGIRNDAARAAALPHASALGGKYLDEGKSKSFGRKAVTFVLVTVTGGVALSALDDLAIYHGCSRHDIHLGIVGECKQIGLSLLSFLDRMNRYVKVAIKAMEKASNSQAIKDAIGEPIVKGPWYNASLAVAHKRQSVSCTFPVSGPHGNGVFQLKAVRNGDDSWFSFFLPRNWEILIMEALLHIPSNEERQQTMRISLSDSFSSPACKTCTECPQQESQDPEKK
ncbi:hypothetical protein POTOM_011188 [Populus tomentosa]|uniref:Uncharacterized protein n=1 Tax=Populus tomentosa TaxID=118781 RepID=A0A8X8AEY0_POPTO|nr:hypothetical protein POTOM_011188 [Populus tomentosa]